MIKKLDSIWNWPIGMLFNPACTGKTLILLKLQVMQSLWNLFLTKNNRFFSFNFLWIFLILYLYSEFRFGCFGKFYTGFSAVKIFVILLFKRVKFTIIDVNDVKFFIETWLFLLYSILICSERKIKKKFRRNEIDVKIFVKSISELIIGVKNKRKLGNQK